MYVKCHKSAVYSLCSLTLDQHKREEFQPAKLEHKLVIFRETGRFWVLSGLHPPTFMAIN
jgi:hypothetical protein